MSDTHTLSSFKPSPAPTESKEEKTVLRAQEKPVQEESVSKTDSIVRRMKDMGFSYKKKHLWYQLGEKKRPGKPNMKFKIGVGKPNSQTAGATFKVEF